MQFLSLHSSRLQTDSSQRDITQYRQGYPQKRILTQSAPLSALRIKVQRNRQKKESHSCE